MAWFRLSKPGAFIEFSQEDEPTPRLFDRMSADAFNARIEEAHVRAFAEMEDNPPPTERLPHELFALPGLVVYSEGAKNPHRNIRINGSAFFGSPPTKFVVAVLLHRKSGEYVWVGTDCGKLCVWCPFRSAAEMRQHDRDEFASDFRSLCDALIADVAREGKYAGKDCLPTAPSL